MKRVNVRPRSGLLSGVALLLCVAMILAIVLMCAGCSNDVEPSTSPGVTNSPGSTPPTSEPGTTGPNGEHVHNYDAVVTEPTCIDGGYTTYTCSICGNSYTDGMVPSLGHTWGDWVVTEEPTVEQTGLRTRTCTLCGETEENVMDKLPDTSQHEHEYATEEVPATCTEGGYIWHECKCGASYKDGHTEALGHDYVKDVTKATCEKDGYTTYTCSVCGVSYKGDAVEATGHDYEDAVVEPTCEKEGYTTHTCKNCGDTYKDGKVKATGHSWGDWRSVTEATCTKDGKSERTCSGCDKLETKKIAAKGHDYQETVVDATCTEDGSSSRICTVCGDKKTTVIPAGHDWSDWKVTKEATENEEGERSRTCAACGEIETEKINKAEHKHSWKTTVVPQTGCTELGYTLWECTTCGYSYKRDYVAAPGHDWSEWKVTKEAEVGCAGEEQRTCKACGEVETVVIPALEDDGEEYESYIDSRVTVKQGLTSVKYIFEGITIYDKRLDWGDDLSIWVNEDNSLSIAYFNKNGERIELVVSQPPDGYSRAVTISKDGTYSVTLVGDPG